MEKQIKTIEPEELDPKSIEGLFPKYLENNKIKSEVNEIKKWEEKLAQMI